MTQLEYVLAVNKYQHFGKAAASCFVTQPTLSMQLLKLENELQVTLFDRSKTPVAPTSQGVAIIEQARVVIREKKRIFGLIEEARGELAGDFKLAVIPTVSPFLIPLFLQDFSQDHPKLNLTIDECKTEDILQLLQNDEVDAALLVTPLHMDALIEKVLYYEPFYLFVSKGHPLSKKGRVKEEDLNIDEIWLLNKGNCFRDQVLSICSQSKELSRKRRRINFASGNFETLKNMVMRNSGYTLLPHLAVDQLSAHQKKSIRKFSKPVPTREVSLVYHKSCLKKRMVDSLEEKILSVIPADLKSLKQKDCETIEFM